MSNLDKRLDKLEELQRAAYPGDELPEEEPEQLPTVEELRLTIDMIDAALTALRNGWIGMNHNPHAEHWINARSGRTGVFPFTVWPIVGACPWPEWDKTVKLSSWLDSECREWHEWMPDPWPTDIVGLIAWLEARKAETLEMLNVKL